jgi:hypothetical protein
LFYILAVDEIEGYVVLYRLSMLYCTKGKESWLSRFGLMLGWDCGWVSVE